MTIRHEIRGHTAFITNDNPPANTWTPESLRARLRIAERRIALLRSDSLDPDMLDERVRAQLDFADPHDLVRMIKN